MKKGTTIRLKKLAATADPAFKPAELSEYKPGSITLAPTPEGLVMVEDLPNAGKSLPIDYTLQGCLQADVEIGRALKMLRTHRNGVEVLGLTETSAIETITPHEAGFLLHTRNSIYMLDVLAQPKED